MPTEPAIQRDNARNRFLAACSLAGAATTAYRGPPVEGSDAPCWVDIARLGSPDAEAALVLCCCLHGAEGLCGSAIVSSWLEQGLQRDLSRDTGLTILHAVLPDGIAIGGAVAPDHIITRDWSDNILSAAARRFARYAKSKGLAADENPEVSNQTARPEWLVEAFDTVATEVTEHAARVGVIEFHTSLHPSGSVTISSCHATGTAADQRVELWFGEESSARTGGPAVLDSFALGFGERLRETELTAINIDFGIYSTRSILGLDARQTVADRRADLGQLFFRNDAAWIANTQTQGTRIIQQALHCLSQTKAT